MDREATAKRFPDERRPARQVGRCNGRGTVNPAERGSYSGGVCRHRLGKWEALFKRTRYQHGSVEREQRKKGTAVWVYRSWEEDINVPWKYLKDRHKHSAYGVPTEIPKLHWQVRLRHIRSSTTTYAFKRAGKNVLLWRCIFRRGPKRIKVKRSRISVP